MKATGCEDGGQDGRREGGLKTKEGRRQELTASASIAIGVPISECARRSSPQNRAGGTNERSGKMSTTTRSAARPAWIELATDDPAAARAFYADLLGWQVDVHPDPQYGGYGMARLPAGDGDVAGIGGKMMPEAPTAWSLYIGTDDVDALSDAVTAAGGSVIAPAFDVGDMGRMAVLR